MSNGKSYYPCDLCGLQRFERNRYFDGKLLVTRDFEDEQAYFRGKDRLHNSLLHGYGTVFGLKVEEHPRPECRDRWVVLNPGLALDSCGHEIVVAERKQIDLLELINAALDNVATTPLTIQIRLAYRECETEPVPALADDCGCNEDDTEFNRVRENYELRVEEVYGALDESAVDPLDVLLDWQHTLTVAVPKAILANWQEERLYVIEWEEGEADSPGTAHLRIYDTTNHRSLTRVPLVISGIEGEEESSIGEPTAAALSNSGDLIYVAADPVEAEGERGNAASLTIVTHDPRDLSTVPPDSATLHVPVDAALGGEQQVVQLGVSPLDDSLYVLMSDGRILRWSSQALRDWVSAMGGDAPEPTTQFLQNAFDSSDTLTVPRDMTFSSDGGWIVVAAEVDADSANRHLIVLNPSQFGTPIGLGNTSGVINLMVAYALPGQEIPIVVKFSYDAEYLYVLCRDGAPSSNQFLYRIEVGDGLDSFIPGDSDPQLVREKCRKLLLTDPVGEEETPPVYPPQVVDIAVSPRDNWIYLHRRLFAESGDPLDRAEVLTLSVDEMENLARNLDDPVNLIPKICGGRADTHGDALFQALVFWGRRLYVAGSHSSQEGSISILYANEAACDAFIRRSLDGVPTVEHPNQGVILATIENYQEGAMVENSADGPNVIDNFTYRPMLPSTNTLRQVIECMLKKGIAEGIPGPRGSQGIQGTRGPGITRAVVEGPTAGGGDEATAGVRPVSEHDLEGDQELVLYIPPGDQGLPGDEGPRGASIEDVELRPTEPGPVILGNATLESIEDSNDSKLVLTMPKFNRVLNASWHHDEVFKIGDDFDASTFSERFVGDSLGMVVAFEQPVRIDTLHRRSVIMLATRPEQNELLYDCRIPLKLEPRDFIEGQSGSRELDWHIREQIGQSRFDLISETADTAAATNHANAVLITPEIGWKQLLEKLVPSQPSLPLHIELTVILRGDWIVDSDGRALDGNHIWPGVPETDQNITYRYERQWISIGIPGRPSGNGTEGGDWISVIHLYLNSV